ncbi:hypothetical protein [Amorphus coralli]|uniref:hypothetical protein n=1 Tax=Amorphus coralli TaxID=340680 RepID=UPI0012EC7C09|nr:hypothetical protein [Amorphus coralli]
MTTLPVRIAGHGETVTICAADIGDDADGARDEAWSVTARDRTGFMLRLALERATDFCGYGSACGASRRGMLAWMGEGAKPKAQESYAVRGGERAKKAG